MGENPTAETAINAPVSEVRGTNQSGMRAHNERLVLSLVRQQGNLAKSAIARMTGLSAQTVSVIVRRLERDGLLLRGKPVRGKVGQPSVPMRLDPDGAYFLGLKIGRRSSELVLTDFLGQVRERRRRAHGYPTPQATVEFADESIADLVHSLPGADRRRVAGLGIAMPFFLWDWAQTLRVPAERMAAWRHADIGAEMAGRQAMPVLLQNDATAACGAELVFGPPGGPRDFLYFYIGFFVGGGIVLNGRIFSGRGNAGALGPLPVPGEGSRVRPLIDVASLYILEQGLQAAGRDAGFLWEPGADWDFSEDILTPWIENAANGLAHAIVSACSVIDFESVKIDGWMPAAVKRRLVAAVQTRLSSFDMTGLQRPDIVEGVVGPDARALGAASLPLSRKYLVEA